MPPSMAWFPVGRNQTPGWRLDVVSLLAILGESLMACHLQPLSASKLCLLPRLTPAPQSFLRSTRAMRLPSPSAVVSGVHSGTLLHNLNYFADVIHPIERMNAYQVTVYEIDWSAKAKHQHITSMGSTSNATPATPQRRTRQRPEREAMVPARKLSPINILTMISFFLTLGAFVCAIAIQDGAAALALIAMSSASTLIGIASYWRPRLTTRPSETAVPDGDMVIRTRDGAFIIIKCTEEIAREIYTGPEECNYLVDDQWFRILVGFGTLLVIVSVLFLGNCDWIMQTVIAVIYVILNALYWVASLLPREWLWDLSRYEWKDVTGEHLKGADQYRDGQAPSYTRSLWYAIQATESVDWVTISGAAPKTAAWEKWLRMAHLNCANRKWDAVGAKDDLMKQVRSQSGSPRTQRLWQQDQQAPVTLRHPRESV